MTAPDRMAGMDETVPAPAFMDDQDLGMKPKRIMTHPESAMQRGVVRFCKRAVACEFEFAAHDRSQEQGDNSHIYEAARGYRRDWPDIELVMAGGRGFRCELKAPGKKPDPNGGQLRIIAKLNWLGHPAAWANSVTMFGEEALRCGVPLTPNWLIVAAHEDQLVAADIRKQEANAAAKRNGTHKPSKSRPRRFTARDRKAAGIYGAMFK